ncbi:DUF3726 domain-containing protein [Jannaschia seohaensis]|uniref:Uncharacterized protein DUF3726 n=1 Tax=Jannaschia seohaensis TaxID=475081 RepID=A0A2Y9BZK3_9RHOB|nr:DUF3726 domain-containing protein [Jannaschia seohaensis]PWJ20428.1 uncharacterized protein DUF3726 [Jannaschia seohaensis]SSA44512.1 Protein of unknown function [Jannaschia seohaensis]
MTELSLNEAAALARKATRGAGYDWGLATEAARAVRWLAMRGQPALDALDALLASETAAPRLEGDRLWAEGPLCALRAGAVAGDLAALPGLAGLRLERVRVPLLVLPFAAGTGRPMRVSGHGVAHVAPEALHLTGDWRGTQDLRLAPCDDAPAPTPPIFRADVSPDALTRLEALAQRTYAPATDASRRLGAGE